MKVLVINGSPKGDKSDTMHLTRAFIEGAGWTDVEILDLSKLNLKSGCTGCYTCWTATPGKCVLKDDMIEVLPKFTEAEVLIWSFPLYGNFFPGQMKCFMDRMIPLGTMAMKEDSATGEHPLRQEMKIQKTFYISGCGFWTTEHNYNTLNTYLRHSGGNPYEFTVFTSQAPLLNEADNDPELKKIVENYLDIVRQAGKEAAAGVISEETNAALRQPLLPKEVYEAAVNAEAK